MGSASYICEMANPAMKKSSLIVDTQAKSRESHFQSKTEAHILKGQQITVLKEYGCTNISEMKQFEKFLVKHNKLTQI